MALSWKFGQVDASGNFSEVTNAHWFMDSYWNGTGTNAVAIQVTNNENSSAYLKSFQFSLINGSSGGTSFTSSDGNAHVTYVSTATITATCSGITSDSVRVPSSDGEFQYSSIAGQSYWKYRPSNSAGDSYPDSDDHSLVKFYTFTFSSGIEMPQGTSKIITFSATWDTSGEHCMQIYATGAISTPVYHKITWHLNGGAHTNSDGSESKDDYIQYLPDGNSNTGGAEVHRDNYSFVRWTSANESVYSSLKNMGDSLGIVIQDRIYTAEWEQKGIIWIRENGVWVKRLFPHKYNDSTKTWTDLGGHENNGSGWSDMS